MELLNCLLYTSLEIFHHIIQKKQHVLHKIRRAAFIQPFVCFFQNLGRDIICLLYTSGPVVWKLSPGSLEKQFRFRQSFQSARPMSGRP